jgi:two-component system response regulator YesN
MDAACSVLYMAITLLPDGGDIVSGIFEGVNGGYRSIYECKSARECLAWIVTLRNGLVGELQSRRQDYRMRVVSRVQRYVEENVCKRLTLGEVASLYGFSQNYLSTLFTKYGGCSFVEYTTNTKIAAAKKMMSSGDLKIHEIAERLGFESAFYFSKVFKKVEGISPRDYMRQGEQNGS